MESWLIFVIVFISSVVLIFILRWIYKKYARFQRKLEATKCASKFNVSLQKLLEARKKWASFAFTIVENHKRDKYFNENPSDVEEDWQDEKNYIEIDPDKAEKILKNQHDHLWIFNASQRLGIRENELKAVLECRDKHMLVLENDDDKDYFTW
jgi:hypothetical protein